MARALQWLLLPSEVSSFEAAYLRRVNRIAMAVLWIHPLMFAVLAVLANGSVTEAVLSSFAVITLPTIGFFAWRTKHPRRIGMLVGATVMVLGGVLVWVDRGPLQIEMDFYFFVMLALLVVFANPMVIVVAAAAVAAHALLWLGTPSVSHNFAAWQVTVQGVFIVLEATAAVFIARTFFNNVIGLERIVLQRTTALDARNGDLQRILDNVAQGFVTVSLDGAIGPERSAALDAWFGQPQPGAKWWDYVADSADAAQWLQLGFEGLREDIMPFDAVVDQMPKRVKRGDKQLEFQYRAIGEPMSAVLAVVTDVTAEIARSEAEAESRELIAVVEKATRDRTGFAGFMREASELVARSVGLDDDLATVRRNLHTLKGNAAAFGATSLADLAHVLEGELDIGREPLSAPQRERLRTAWRTFQRRVEPLGLTAQRPVVVERDEYQNVMGAIVTKSAASEPGWLRRIRQWGMDPTRPHLVRMGEQAVALSTRLGKGDLVVDVQDHDLRIDDERFHAVWAALVHAVRNAVAHGIEFPERRRRSGKPAAPRMQLTTKLVGGDVVIEVRDDGAGVDWERVAQRAKERGLPAITRNDLDAALFAGGVSTADQVTDVSGRGVGLDALRTACNEIGGRVEIESEPNRGTVVRCIVALVQPARRRSGRTSVSA